MSIISKSVGKPPIFIGGSFLGSLCVSDTTDFYESKCHSERIKIGKTIILVSYFEIMCRIKDSRPWYKRGKVLEIAETDSDGEGYRHPVRLWTGDEWDNFVARGLMRQGYTVVIFDYDYKFDIPDVYNDIPENG